MLRLELMLFGIDLAMIEPGFVNTAMYDKGEEEDLSEIKPTAYARAHPLSVWEKPSIWHSARQNLRHATRSFRNVSRTGLCSDSFL